jgi:hypothetical protein
VVRSFINLVIDDEGNVIGSDSKKVTVHGGEDDDTIDVKGEANSTEKNNLKEFSVKGEDPDYVVNALVDVGKCIPFRGSIHSTFLRFLLSLKHALC